MRHFHPYIAPGAICATFGISVPWSFSSDESSRSTLSPLNHIMGRTSTNLSHELYHSIFRITPFICDTSPVITRSQFPVYVTALEAQVHLFVVGTFILLDKRRCETSILCEPGED